MGLRNKDTARIDADMKVFVTGGSGLVGSTVIDLLLSRGDEVLAIDNFATGRRDNIKPQPRLQLIEESIVHERVVDGLIGDFRPDVVVHTAASYKNPDDWQEDMQRGLSVIESRSESLSRFMAAYAQLAKLPPPRFQSVDIASNMGRCLEG